MLRITYIKILRYTNMKIVLSNVLLMVLLRWNTDVMSAIAPECENCGCCVDGVCAYTGGVDNFCTHGCQAGYRGHRCLNKCPDDCSPCGQWALIDDSCTTCDIGEYPKTGDGCLNCTNNCDRCIGPKDCITCKQSYYGRNCTKQCPTECKTCTSATNCQECHPPYLNDVEITNCSLTCRRNCICKTPGLCGSCKEGYYNTNDDCRGQCPEACNTCSSPHNCQSCKDGFYNGRQEAATLGEITDCSLTCKDTCISCTSHNVCTICKQGYYGTFCQFQCSVGCLRGECDKVDGSCACIDNFSGGQCTECIPGRHGIQCEKQCPTCPNNGQGVTCNKQDGTCLRCFDGFYGNYCNKACPVTCLNSRCVQETGRCTDGCIYDYEGPFCFPAQAETTVHTASIIGIGVGISSAITFICVVVMVVGACIVIRKWKRKQQLLTEASYVNTQLQNVSATPLDNEQPQHGYEDFQTGHQAQDKDYDTI